VCAGGRDTVTPAPLISTALLNGITAPTAPPIAPYARALTNPDIGDITRYRLHFLYTQWNYTHSTELCEKKLKYVESFDPFALLM